jgi:GPH family glycoside/pentoside/hexuronide:cation symporter
MAASLFALKVGVAVGGAALAWILGGHGFAANQAQTARGLEGIRLVTSIYPAVFAILAMALMFLYPLDKSRMDRVESELIERRRRLRALP